MKMLRASNKHAMSSARPIDSQAPTRPTEKGVLDEPQPALHLAHASDSAIGIVRSIQAV